MSVAEAADLERRFGALRRLYGDEGYRQVRAARVAVVGLGGVGSWAVEALARCGVAALVLIDLDHVAESNINRQVQALGATLGQAKAVALRERVADIHPGCAVSAVEEFADAANWPALLPHDVDAVIDAFGTSRLLTFDRDQHTREPTVEIAHEALIEQWPRFAEWVATAGEGLRIQGQLAEASRTWERLDRDDGDLYRGLRLESALEWADSQPENLSPLEREFLAASGGARTAEIEADRAQAERDHRANRRLRGLLVGVGLLLVVLLGSVWR